MAKTMYKIQIGAYRQKSNAQKMAAKLKKAGIPATIITAGDLMKVQCGAFSVKANADKRLAEVKKKGFLNAVLITVPGTEKTASAPVVTTAGRIRIAALAFFDTGNEAQQYGDCTALISWHSTPILPSRRPSTSGWTSSKCSLSIRSFLRSLNCGART